MAVQTLFMGLFSSTNSFLGIDIGSTSIKVVELKKDAGKPELISYGFSENKKARQNDWQKDTSQAAEVITKICAESGIMGKSAVSALPTYSVFSSVLNLSNIIKKDISSAVHWEAKKVIPLPLEEMILDWKRIETTIDKNEKKSGNGNLKVLLTGAPKTLVKKYVEIFRKAQISLLSLETETFSLIRSLVGNDRSTVMLVEIGAGTTDVTIVDNTIPILSRSIDVGGITITKIISERIQTDYSKAEQFKYDLGIASIDSAGDEVPKIITEAIAPIVNEIKYAINLFQNKNKKKTEKIILSGGSALLPNLVNYLSKILDIKVIIGDPWARINYPQDLKPLLQEIGPKMSVAIGLALREME